MSLLEMDDLFGPPPIDVSDIPADVLNQFRRLTFQVIEAGYSKYSADAILHRIRWHMKIERGSRDFKCNDHWTSALSRWFIQENPEHIGFFELRVSQYEKVA